MATSAFTSESVTEGHPDKLADQISDAVLDELLTQDSLARVACETYITAGLVVVGGEITSTGGVNIGQIVRDTIINAGYTTPEFGFDVNQAVVTTATHHQSPDIAAGVEHALEERTDRLCDAFDEIGAGDMGTMYGFACDETPELMPLPISLAHRLARRLAEVRRTGAVPFLRPDGKVQVTVVYDRGLPVAVTEIVVSAQHDPDVDIERTLRPVLLEQVLKPTLPAELVDYAKLDFLLNTTGKFVIGGPAADTGLSGRKQAVDTYGGMARHGGSSFSGKDPTKVDRSGAYGARYVAKNIVAAGLATRCEVQVSYAIGVAHPVCVAVDTFGTERVEPTVIERLIGEHFDLRPAALILQLDLRRPIYKKTAVYGHFGRTDAVFTWERTDKAESLRQAAGL